jgi:hypothetical protein
MKKTRLFLMILAAGGIFWFLRHVPKPPELSIAAPALPPPVETPAAPPTLIQVLNPVYTDIFMEGNSGSMILSAKESLNKVERIIRTSTPTQGTEIALRLCSRMEAALACTSDALQRSNRNGITRRALDPAENKDFFAAKIETDWKKKINELRVSAKSDWSTLQSLSPDSISVVKGGNAPTLVGVMQDITHDVFSLTLDSDCAPLVELFNKAQEMFSKAPEIEEIVISRRLTEILQKSITLTQNAQKRIKAGESGWNYSKAYFQNNVELEWKNKLTQLQIEANDQLTLLAAAEHKNPFLLDDQPFIKSNERYKRNEHIKASASLLHIQVIQSLDDGVIGEICETHAVAEGMQSIGGGGRSYAEYIPTGKLAFIHGAARVAKGAETVYSVVPSGTYQYTTESGKMRQIEAFSTSIYAQQQP